MKKLLLGLVLAAFASQSMAKEPGLYVGVGLGMTQNPSYDEMISQPYSAGFNYKEFSGNLYLGYHFQVSDAFYIGPEISFSTLGGFTAGVTDNNGNQVSTDISFSGLNFMVASHYRFNQKFGGEFKAGVSRVDVDADSSWQLVGGNLTYTNHTSEDLNTTPVIQLGMTYELTKHASMVVEFEHIFGSEDDILDYDDNTAIALNSLRLGLRYNF